PSGAQVASTALSCQPDQHPEALGLGRVEHPARRGRVGANRVDARAGHQLEVAPDRHGTRELGPAFVGPERPVSHAADIEFLAPDEQELAAGGRTGEGAGGADHRARRLKGHGFTAQNTVGHCTDQWYHASYQWRDDIVVDAKFFGDGWGSPGVRRESGGAGGEDRRLREEAESVEVSAPSGTRAP